MAKQTLHRTAALFRCKGHTYRIQRPTTTVIFPHRLQNLDAGRCTQPSPCMSGCSSPSPCMSTSPQLALSQLQPSPCMSGCSSLPPSDQPLPWHAPAEEQWWQLLRVTQDTAELAMLRPIPVLTLCAAIPDKQALAALG